METLVALFVTSLTILLITFLIQHVQTIYHTLEKDDFYEWHVFLHQYDNEVDELVLDYAKDSRLNFISENPDSNITYSVTFSQYGSVLRRQVDSKGHQPMLTAVKLVQFKENDRDVTVDVTFLSGDTYRAYLPAQKKEEVEIAEE